MVESHKKFYVTTPIYYVNARPHLGTLYSTLLADVVARWQQIHGKKTFLLTGTDEHGQKIAEAASKVTMEPQAFVDQFTDSFKDLWRDYEIEYSYFMRTTADFHVKAIQEWLTLLINKGDIYKSYYTGLYCTSCEAFVTEKDIEDQKGISLCPNCGRETRQISEESYFFKLSAYQDQLLAFYEEHPEFVTPAERINEVKNFVKAGLKDLSISRTTLSWGIPFPNDNKHVTYVWADALNNYITAIGWGDEKRTSEFNYWWPADVQVMGKDIIRFHAIYWPAFLMASGLELPKKLLVHGWIKVGDQKMSKSLGNAIDPVHLLSTYGAEPIRYYLTRHMAITQDSSFSIPDLVESINADLANALSNLVHRTLTLAHKFNLIIVEPMGALEPAELELQAQLQEMLVSVEREMKDYYFHRAYGEVWKFIHHVNAYFHSQEPWKATTDQERFKRIISATCHSLYALSIVIWPLMPHKMTGLLQALGYTFIKEHNYYKELQESTWSHTFRLSMIAPLFTKIEHEKPVMEDIKKTVSPEVIVEPDITIEDFLKVKVLVGTIEQVDEVPKSEKLYVLRVNFGDHGIRQICSGVKAYFVPNDLLGKQGLFVFNLKPRKIMGLESHGMMLFAKNAEGKCELLLPQNPVRNGTQIG